VGVYQEARGSGLVGAGSRTSGLQSSLAYARAPVADGLGWRALAWLNTSNLSNASVSTAPARASTTPANDQYATPATAAGANAALRRTWNTAALEAGVDVRAARGDDKELFKWTGQAFSRARQAGGDTGVAGLYVEGSARAGGWLFAGGARLDAWGDWNGRRIETNRATGASTLDQRPADRSGLEPTLRLGARRDLGQGLYLRAAAYDGFRPATLNELYRPFRVGNNITQANAALSPERLYGVEAGAGLDGGNGGVAATVFYNRLKDAVANVTIAQGPYTDAVEGFIPAGGILFRRENVGAVDARGLEANAWRTWGARLRLEAALSWTDAEVDGARAAPQLTGRRPAETPRFAAVATAVWRPVARLSLRGEVRGESVRFADDLNQLRLAPDTVVNLRADWTLNRRLGLYAAADNLFDAGVQTDRAASTPAGPGVVSWGAPAQVRVGLVVR
jgi:outer membrane receptor protein involved in Fe transport